MDIIPAREYQNCGRYLDHIFSLLDRNACSHLVECRNKLDLLFSFTRAIHQYSSKTKNTIQLGFQPNSHNYFGLEKRKHKWNIHDDYSLHRSFCFESHPNKLYVLFYCLLIPLDLLLFVIKSSFARNYSNFTNGNMQAQWWFFPGTRVQTVINSVTIEKLIILIFNKFNAILGIIKHSHKPIKCLTFIIWVIVYFSVSKRIVF